MGKPRSFTIFIISNKLNYTHLDPYNIIYPHPIFVKKKLTLDFSDNMHYLFLYIDVHIMYVRSDPVMDSVKVFNNSVSQDQSRMKCNTNSNTVTLTVIGMLKFNKRTEILLK